MKYEDGKYYHLYNRGANKQNIFRDDGCFRRCLRLFEKYLVRYHVSLMAYCLMPNHYHLFVRQNEGTSISRFIQTTFNAYTQGTNLITGHSGTLFQGRVKGREITSEEYALRLIRYIHYNPAAAGFVRRPEMWKYSDYLDWIGLRKRGISDLALRDEFFYSPEDYRNTMDEYVLDKEIERDTEEGWPANFTKVSTRR